MATRAKLFKSNRSQAVRLPKAVAFPEGIKEVEITRSGESLIVTPVGTTWDELFARGPQVSDDFMTDREQGEVEERQPL